VVMTLRAGVLLASHATLMCYLSSRTVMRMSDDLSDLLATVREVEKQVIAQRRSRKGQKMTVAQRQDYLRRRGWRRTSSTGSQKWTDETGRSATLSGAVSIQLAMDYGTDA